MTGAGGVAAVPDEAVEAAAKAQYEQAAKFARVSWSQLSEASRAGWRVNTARVLAAAAPVFRAAVLREAADAWDEVRRIGEMHPRKVTPEQVAKWDQSAVAITDRCMAGEHDFGAWLRLLAAGGSPEVDNNESEARDA